MTNPEIRILHIGSDEKFIDAANYIFEKAFPDSNTFLIPHSRFNKHLKFVTQKSNIKLININSKLIKNLLQESESYDCIILHGITDINGTVYLTSKEKHKFVGILWGAELFTQENFPEKSFLGKKTASIQLPKIESSQKARIRSAFKKLIYHKSVTIANATNQAALKLGYFALLFDESLEYLKENKLVSSDCRHIPFTYYPLEYIIKGNETLTIDHHDILLGNSASFSNNHLEAFDILKSLNIKQRKIIVPLSYGNSSYADYIQRRGSEIFNNQFEPMRYFLPLEEYRKKLQKCGIVIMNHYRSQAVGNILMMLWLGSKVFLHESNPLFYFLKRNGIIIYSINKDLTNNNPMALEKLSTDEIGNNRNILRKTISEKYIIEGLRKGILKYFS